MDSTTYRPASIKVGETPLVVALPGIVHKDDQTRMDGILRTLTEEQGFLGIKINYPDFEAQKEGKLIRCHLDIDKIVDGIRINIERAIETEGASSSRIGLISNSISALPASRYLANNIPLGYPLIRAYASISPLLGWKHFANEEWRNKIIKSGRDLPISTAFDEQIGITRVIPVETLQKIQEIDCLEELEKQIYRADRMQVMTIMGTKDVKSNPDSMRRSHELLGGYNKWRIELEAGHDVPDSNKYVIDFMAQVLGYN